MPLFVVVLSKLKDQSYVVDHQLSQPSVAVIYA